MHVQGVERSFSRHARGTTDTRFLVRRSTQPLELPLQDSNLVTMIQSSPVGACLEDPKSASGGLPSIGAPTVGLKCPVGPERCL